MFESADVERRIDVELQKLGLRGVTVTAAAGDGGSHFAFGPFSQVRRPSARSLARSLARQTSTSTPSLTPSLTHSPLTHSFTCLWCFVAAKTTRARSPTR